MKSAYREDGHPIFCPECGSSDLQNDVKSWDRGFVYEYVVICGNCKEHVAYWAYGSYDPAYYEDRKNGVR